MLSIHILNNNAIFHCKSWHCKLFQPGLTMYVTPLSWLDTVSSHKTRTDLGILQVTHGNRLRQDSGLALISWKQKTLFFRPPSSPVGSFQLKFWSFPTSLLYFLPFPNRLPCFPPHPIHRHTPSLLHITTTHAFLLVQQLPLKCCTIRKKFVFSYTSIYSLLANTITSQENEVAENSPA